MPKLVGALVALLCLVPLVGCGSDDDSTSSERGLSKAAFIEKGDAVCDGLTTATAKISPPTSNDEVSGYLEKTIALAKRSRADFAALDAPAGGKDVQKALLDSLDKLLGIADKALKAADAGDFAAMTKLLNDSAGANKEADAAARSYGFKACGKSA